MRRIDRSLITALSRDAADTPRLRSHHNWHAPDTDPVQRFFVHMQAGTYVRPHCHALQQRVETTVVVDGHVDLLCFTADGILDERIALSSHGDVRGIEIPPDVWHSYLVVDPVTLFEVKQGPYDAERDKHFAAWAPPEGDPRVTDWLAWAQGASPGQRWPGTPGSPESDMTE